MCGIAAVYKKGTGQVDREDLAVMASMLPHRGPDDRGAVIMAGGRVGLAHVRLSVVDLEHGRQPMSNREGTLTISFNGEIYDYKEHRRDLLARGHVLGTESDTEVLLHLYERVRLRLRDATQRRICFRPLGRPRAQAARRPGPVRRQAALL